MENDSWYLRDDELTEEERHLRNLYQAVQQAIAQGRYPEAKRLTEQEFLALGNLLQYAVDDRNLELAKWGIAQGLDLRNERCFLTPFMRACKDGLEDLARLFVASEPALASERTRNCGMYPRRTPLMFAAGCGVVSLAEYLVSLGADVNAQDDMGFTALMAAAAYGQTSMLEYLVSLGADVSLWEETGLSALDYAIQSGTIAAVEFLLNHGASIKGAPDASISIPLWSAIDRNNAKMVELLLSNGADPTWRSLYGEDALGYAARIQAAPEILGFLSDHLGRTRA